MGTHRLYTVLAGLTNAASATMAAVDRYGFELAVTKPEGPRATRLAFDEPVATKDEIRGAIIEMVERARSMIPTGDDRAER